MSKKSNNQDRLWEQVASLFEDPATPPPPPIERSGENNWGEAIEPGFMDGDDAEDFADLNDSLETDIDDDRIDDFDEADFALPATSPSLQQKPPASSTREETIRMIGEAIDVQTDFPGFDQLESPSYLSHDLNHLLSPEDTEEKLETQVDTEDLQEAADSSSESQTDLPQEPRQQTQPQQGQQNPQAFGGSSEDSQDLQSAVPDDTRPTEDADDFLGEPSPRAFPGKAWKPRETSSKPKDLPSIIKAATEQAIETARREKEAEKDPNVSPDEAPTRSETEPNGNPFQSAPWEGN